MSEYEFVLNKLAVNIDKAAKKAYQDLIGMIDEGAAPQEALNIIFLSFKKGSFNETYIKVLSESFTSLLKEQFSPEQMLSYPIGNVKLSTKLYQNSTIIAQDVMKLIEAHAKGFQDLRKLTLEIFSGYNQKSNEVLKTKDVVGKYLVKAWSPIAPEIDRLLARQTAEKLVTPALRAAYLQSLDKIEQGAGKKALQKAMESAAYEKTRYLSSRLANNELSIAYFKKTGIEIRNRSDVEWVQFRVSGRHEPDLCNLHSDIDRYGMGSGVYPKNEAPVPPRHLWCRCRLISRIDLDANPSAKENKNAEREYLAKLKEDDRKEMLTAGQRNYIEGGGNITDYLNQRQHELYKLKTIGEL